MANSLSLSKPVFIKDKSVVGVLLPNTKNFSKALKDFVANLALEKLEKEEQKAFEKWDKTFDTPEAHKRYDAIIADADANDGWVDGEKFFNELRESRK